MACSAAACGRVVTATAPGISPRHESGDQRVVLVELRRRCCWLAERARPSWARGPGMAGRRLLCWFFP
ncbi:MAG TPA: hypothetical protein VJ254_02685 [Streptosporangiaceae bacterium]|nr:hypothetical protein [Streptosporangiaceae bacterium]